MSIGPDPDPDVDLYDIRVSEQSQELFDKIVEAHKVTFEELPEGGEWLQNTSNYYLASLGAPPETVEAIIQIILDVWKEEVLDVNDTRFHDLITDMEIEAWDEDRVPNGLQRQ